VAILLGICRCVRQTSGGAYLSYKETDSKPAPASREPDGLPTAPHPYVQSPWSPAAQNPMIVVLKTTMDEPSG